VACVPKRHRLPHRAIARNGGFEDVLDACRSSSSSSTCRTADTPACRSLTSDGHRRPRANENGAHRRRPRDPPESHDRSETRVPRPSPRLATRPCGCAITNTRRFSRAGAPPRPTPERSRSRRASPTGCYRSRREVLDPLTGVASASISRRFYAVLMDSACAAGSELRSPARAHSASTHGS
jgi:hypothetical protein